MIRRGEQHVAKEASGWERRILSPVLPGVEFEFMRTTIGAHVDAGEFAPHAAGSREYLGMESGTLLLTIDGVEHKLKAGDRHGDGRSAEGGCDEPWAPIAFFEGETHSWPINTTGST